MNFTVTPSYFFVAHCQVGYRATKRQMMNLQKLAPAAKIFATTSSNNPRLATFIAIFLEPVDFEDLRQKFSYFFGGKSKILSVHHSGTEVFPNLDMEPTCFYSAHLVQDYTRTEQNNGRVAADQAKIATTLALTGLSRTTRFTFSASEILLCSTEPFLPRTIIEITQVINTMQISDFLSAE